MRAGKHFFQINKAVNAEFTIWADAATLRKVGFGLMDQPRAWVGHTVTGDREKNEPLSPGEIIRRAMEGRGWTQSDLAYVLGASTSSINPVLSGKRGISPEMAKALASAFDMPAEVFAKAQAEWELLQAKEPDPAVSARARVQSAYPLREMIKRGWLDEDAELEPQLCRFFGVGTLLEAPHIAHAARKTAGSEIPASQLAWLFRVRQIAREMLPSKPYSSPRLVEAVETFKAMRNSVEHIRQVPRVLNEAGVRFVVVEPLPGSKIDGVCTWLDSGSPVVGISLRFDRIDNFWFVLRHELSHVLHLHGQSGAIVDTELEQPGSDVSAEERIANGDAAEFCVPQTQIHSFYLRKNPLFSERDVLAFAKRMEVHPGLVVGQLQRLTARYDLLRRHLVKVRHVLADAMMMDGWGDVMPVDR